MEGRSEELLDALVEFVNGVEAAVAKLKRDLYDLALKGADKPSWDPDKIVWQKAESSKGVYERADGELNRGSVDFEGLLADLKAHGGKLSRLGFFYWLFEQTATPTVGRKPKTKSVVK